MDRSANDLSLSVALSYVDRGASQGMRQFGSIMAGLGGPLGIASAGMLGFGAIAIGAIAKSVDMAAAYQKTLNMVAALTGSSQAQMAQYDVGLKQLAIDSGVAPTKLASGLYYVISAGYKGADALNMLSLATKDAVIGLTDSKITSMALTTVMQGFNEKTSQMNTVNGELLRTVTLGRMSMQDYAGAISKVAVLHAQYHVTLEDTNATLATLTSSGYKSAAIAATGYSALVSIMDGKTDLMTKRIHKLGLGFDESYFKTLSYSQQLAYLNKTMAGHYDQLQNVLGGSKQAASAFTTLETHSKMFTDNLKALSDQQKNAQATQQAWAITQGGFSQTMNRLNAAVQVLGINVGSLFLPILTRLVGALIPVIALAANWVLQLVLLEGTFSDLLTPAVKVFSEAIFFVGYYFDRQLRPAVKLLTDDFNALWGQLANPGQLNDTLKQSSDWMVRTGTPVYTAYAHVVGDILGGSYLKLASDARTALVATAQVGANMGKQIAESISVHVASSLKNIKMPSVGGLPGGDMLAQFMGPLKQIMQIFGQIGQFFQGLFQPFIDEWNRVKKDLMPSIIQFQQWWQQTMGPLFGGMGDKAKGAKSPLKDLLDMAGNMFLFFTKLGMILIEYILPLLVKWWGFLSIPIGFIFSLLSKLWDFLANDGIDTIQSFFTQFSGFITNVVDLLGNIKDTVGKVLGWIGDHIGPAVDGWKKFMKGFGDFVSGVWNDVLSGFTNVINFIIGQANTVIDVLNHLPHPGTPDISHIPLIMNGSASTGVGATIPSFASGVENFEGGLARVHRDELLVNMSRGSSVLTASQARGMLAGGNKGGGHSFYNQTNNITIAVTGRSDNEVKTLADKLEIELANRWRRNANIQTATSGSVRS